MEQHYFQEISLYALHKPRWPHRILRMTLIAGLLMLLLAPRGSRSRLLAGREGSALLPADSFLTITIAAAGDNMMHMPQIAAACDPNLGNYFFYPVFQYIKPIVSSADLGLVNLETTLAGEPFSGYPRFSAPDEIAAALQEAGFNFFVNANNHALDRGGDGLKRTLRVMDSLGIRHTGTFSGKSERESSYPYILRMKGMKLAILNYTYGTNMIQPPDPWMINYSDTSLMAKDMQRARDSMPDLLLVCMHWGNEYERHPDSTQKFLARFLFDRGADVIIGSHPHVIQPVGSYDFTYQGRPKQGLVFWSLGNFFSNQRGRYCDGGLIVKFKVRINRFTGKKEILEAEEEPVWVYRSDLPAYYTLLPCGMIDAGKLKYHMTPMQKEYFDIFMWDTREQMQKNTFPVSEMQL